LIQYYYSYIILIIILNFLILSLIFLKIIYALGFGYCIHNLSLYFKENNIIFIFISYSIRLIINYIFSLDFNNYNNVIINSCVKCKSYLISSNKENLGIDIELPIKVIPFNYREDLYKLFILREDAYNLEKYKYDKNLCDYSSFSDPALKAKSFLNYIDIQRLKFEKPLYESIDSMLTCNNLNTYKRHKILKYFNNSNNLIPFDPSF
jgi:hypothetical protein